jgi:hypothetical protein
MAGISVADAEKQGEASPEPRESRRFHLEAVGIARPHKGLCNVQLLEILKYETWCK